MMLLHGVNDNIQISHPFYPGENQENRNARSLTRDNFVRLEPNQNRTDKMVVHVYPSKLGFYIRPLRNLKGDDKIRPYHVRRKDTKDTVGRCIVLLPEEKADSCQHDSE